MKGIKLLASVVFVTAVIPATMSLGATTYPNGFVWNRSNDWKPGVMDDSTVGNPCTDSAGNPVWSAQYIDNVPAGSDLDSNHPWYELPSSGLMAWDGHWGGGTWAQHFDDPPTAAHGFMGHITTNDSYFGNPYPNVPLVVWQNPSSKPLDVSLTSGPAFQVDLNLGMPTGTVADVAIAWTDASDGNSVHLLYSSTVEKSLDASSAELVGLSPLDIQNLALDPGDNLLFTVRSRTITTGFEAYAVAFFDDVNITAVPEPATLFLLGVGGMLVMRRRRRRS